MQKDHFDSIITRIKSIDSKKPELFDPAGKTFMFSKDNFSKITSGSDTETVYIDGSNAEILGSNNFSLQFVRVCAASYKGKNRQWTIREEFYALAQATTDGNQLRYEIRFFPEQTILSLNPYDDTLRNGTQRISLAAAGDFARQKAEYSLAEKAAERMTSGVIVRDGSLKPIVTGEEEWLTQLILKAGNHGVSVAGLSKTTDMISTAGKDFIAAVAKEAPKGAWYYRPIVEHRLVDTILAKLHERSQHTFKIEVAKPSDIGKTISAIAANSRDPVFVGYPYGLVDAHKSCIVTNQEKREIRQVFELRAGKDWQAIENELHSRDGHEFLDRL